MAGYDPASERNLRCMSSTLRNTARQEKRTITEPEGTAYAGRNKESPALESDEETS